MKGDVLLMATVLEVLLALLRPHFVFDTGEVATHLINLILEGLDD